MPLNDQLPSAGAVVSETEAVRRERNAAERAVKAVMSRLRGNAAVWTCLGSPLTNADARAAVRSFVESQDFRDIPKLCSAPLPLVTRPRVVRNKSRCRVDCTLALSLRDGVLVCRYEYRDADRTLNEWYPVRDCLQNNESLRADFQFVLDAYADLNANPTETVSEDDAR